MSFYSTPLQFGYLFALLMSILFALRGIHNSRLSDKLLAFLMLILALELQDYTFGFSGINVLWEELNGFPRSVSLLFGPAIYFYLRSQLDRSFQLQSRHLVHLIPWTLSFLFYLSVFVRGPRAVQQFQGSLTSEISFYIGWVILMISYTYYFYQCFRLYAKYREWTPDYFSDTVSISFSWFRNFMLLMILWISVKEVTNVLSLFTELSFYQDWWWNLFLVAVVIYTGISGLTQIQPTNITFDPGSDADATRPIEFPEKDYSELADRLESVMLSERLYLQSDLSLSGLAKHLQVNAQDLSATINSVLGLNYNDYINGLRIKEFESLSGNSDYAHYSLLALAHEAGFNSKATFYRSFKKIKGITPKEYLDSGISP